MKWLTPLFVVASMVLPSKAQSLFVNDSFDESTTNGPATGAYDHPYPTLSRAVEAAAAGSVVAIQAGTYREFCRLPLTIEKPLALSQTGGPAMIGHRTANQKLCTQRITQLTGGYDVEGKRLPLNFTPEWGVAGVDLGANCEFNGRLYFFFGDVVPPIDISPPPGAQWPERDTDLIAYTTDATPEDGLRLDPVTDNQGVFYPFTFKDINDPRFPNGVTILRDQTPTGAFSYGSNVYVFFFWKDEHSNAHSSLARSPDPSQPAPFILNLDFTWSTNFSPMKFLQVAPLVVRNGDFTNLPAGTGDGLIMFGQSPNAVYLAWMPLETNREPAISNIRYYSAPGWTANEWAATPLFNTKYFWTSLSVGRIHETGDWILLYQRTIRGDPNKAIGPDNSNDPEESIVVRIAKNPTDFAQPENGEIPIFTPVKDGAYAVLGRSGGFIHRESLGKDELLRTTVDHMPDNIAGNGFPYGAYLMNRYTRYERSSRTLRIYYLLSTAMPYQVQVMRSDLQLAN